MRYLIFGLLCAVAFFAVWVRLAPLQAEKWHVAPTAPDDGDVTGVGSHTHRRAASGVQVAALDAIIQATPRTQVIAGSLEQGLVTYVTRTKLWGFPDYTTLSFDGQELILHGRLRFGKSDMGVNRARIMKWLSQLDATSAISE